MRFGIFLPPHHVPVGQNPTYSLQRDVELVQMLDRMGFDEAWFGEHHSCGVEPIGDPLMFIAHVAQVTKNIKLGAGVLSLPYHNPFLVADRLILLDHLTRGRAMMGVGPGALATDAQMLGLDPADARAALETDVDVLMHLLRSDEPISIDTGRYKLVEARLQMDAYSDPHPEIATAAIVSPSGPRLVGKHGLGMISIGATMSQEGFDALGMHWSVVEERAKEFGQDVNREGWRLVGPMHIADTKDQAIKDVAYGIDAWFDYLQHTAAAPQLGVMGENTKERIDFVIESGMGIIGTAADAITQIERLEEQSQGGFGAYLMFAHNWAPWEETQHHYHLFANHVMPVFKKTTKRLLANEAWTRSVRDPLAAKQWDAINAFTAKHQAEQEAKTQGSMS
ncbi:MULTISPECIES: LLM class flavin-dependent oxidoreductase [unclassified Pseudonocardia]|jgi:limonene 1,2-monooxygenase|uniref:LLM class flavin-dependent oxidoreductase n=1 Tax=unclassified Pseudonocardia TaxID=2619320 RepID=UPI0025F25C9A|nr:MULTISPECIES: LLM class flavin-dependent oxidoreductase [unclassified Pseudonocardia]